MNSESLTSNQHEEVKLSSPEFDGIKSRLDELVSLVSDDTLSLDKALDYYEEAVRLGMQASTLLEEGIAANDEEISEEHGAEQAAEQDNDSFASQDVLD